VYSEICQRIDRKSAVQLHIWQHLVQYVCTNPYEIAGAVGRRYLGRPWFEFYVDPRTGLLRKADRRNRRHRRAMENIQFPRKPAPPTRLVVPINDNRCYEHTDGAWHEVELRKAPASGFIYHAGTLCEVKFEPRGGFREYRGRKMYVGAKRKLDKREAKRVWRMYRARVEQELAAAV
jgi:hypothetical protein